MNQQQLETDVIRILVVDDQRMIREGIKALLEPESDFQIVGDADNGNVAVEKTELLLPDVVLLDIQMPKMDGITACQSIKRRFPKTRVLILSSLEDQESLNKALASGATGYLLKKDVFVTETELSNAIRLACKGHAQLLPGLVRRTSINVDDNNIELDLEQDKIQGADFSQFKPEILEEIKQEILEKLQEKTNYLQIELSQEKAFTRQLRRELKELKQVFNGTILLALIAMILLTVLHFSGISHH